MEEQSIMRKRPSSWKYKLPVFEFSDRWCGRSSRLRSTELRLKVEPTLIECTEGIWEPVSMSCNKGVETCETGKGLVSLEGTVDALKSEPLERRRPALLSRPKGLKICIRLCAVVLIFRVNDTISVIMFSRIDLKQWALSVVIHDTSGMVHWL
jgi:hypothetical protein